MTPVALLARIPPKADADFPAIHFLLLANIVPCSK